MPERHSASFIGGQSTQRCSSEGALSRVNMSGGYFIPFHTPLGSLPRTYLLTYTKHYTPLFYSTSSSSSSTSFNSPSLAHLYAWIHGSHRTHRQFQLSKTTLCKRSPILTGKTEAGFYSTSMGRRLTCQFVWMLVLGGYVLRGGARCSGVQPSSYLT